MMFSTNPTADKSKTDFVAPSAGLGLNFRLSENVMFQIQETFYYSGSDDKDSIVANSNEVFLQHTVGFTFNLGKKKDSDNDGVGDIRGIISKLDYLKDLGINACWLSPILMSPQVVMKYYIIDNFLKCS